MKRLTALFSLLSLTLLLLGTTGQGQAPHTYDQFAVASDHALASRAGAEVLEAGGNAADAAAATMLALGVVNPGSSGLGGGGFALYYDAESDSLTFLDFRERAPGAATADMFANQGDGQTRASVHGGKASGVPGEPAGIDELIRRFGSKPRGEIAAPAIELADDGFPLSAYQANFSGYFGEHMRADPVMRRWFVGEETAIQPGFELRQPELAATLRTFAAQGSQPFYRGRIARDIVRQNRRNGGIMTMADLRDYEVAEREPLSAQRLGYRWVTAPPPSAGGYTILASLALLEQWIPESRRSAGGPELMHALAESFKGPFFDRATYFGDPDHVDVPLDELLDGSRVARRAALYRPSLAVPGSRYALPLPRPIQETVQPENAGTSHLCVVDAAGNVASITSTINLPFGARYTAAGMVMNNEMDDFASAVGAANFFGLPGGASNLPAPGKRPVSTMSPTIVFDDDGPALCLGGSGGSRIVTATIQVAWHALLRGQPIHEAVEHARIHHQGLPASMRIEEYRPLTESTQAQLMARGHQLETFHHSAVVQAIRIDRSAERRLSAASDSRKGGVPAGR